MSGRGRPGDDSPGGSGDIRGPVQPCAAEHRSPAHWHRPRRSDGAFSVPTLRGVPGRLQATITQAYDRVGQAGQREHGPRLCLSPRVGMRTRARRLLDSDPLWPLSGARPFGTRLHPAGQRHRRDRRMPKCNTAGLPIYDSCPLKGATTWASFHADQEHHGI